jgi:hypothetical protein
MTKYKTHADAIRKHGEEASEETIGTEDRLIGYTDGSWGFQLRGSAEIAVGETRDDTIEAYEKL